MSKPSYRTRERLIGALTILGKGLGVSALLLGTVVLVTWKADYWLLRDRFEHIGAALWGEYLPPACRDDRRRCTTDKDGRLIVKPGLPNEVSELGCDDRPGLKLICTLYALQDYFNRELFDGQLPRAVIVLHRHPGAAGYFAYRKFKVDGEWIDEIALNPATFKNLSMLRLASTLVHELVHLRQAHFGKPGSDGFHNAEWAQMMRRVGLEPTATGKPGGAITGLRVTHMIIPGGLFDVAARAHPSIGKEMIRLVER